MRVSLRFVVFVTPSLRCVHVNSVIPVETIDIEDAAHAAAEDETALSLSEGVVTDTAIRYLLVRAWRQNGNPDRAATHAEAIRAQEAAANNRPVH